ncbi:MAG: hypothetical protein IJV36_03400 [Prevotella sp.]|nr:hypothetical protein [Prevotella sp.]
MKISKNRYLQAFCLSVVLLGIIRAVFPSVAMTSEERAAADSLRVVRDSLQAVADSLQFVREAEEKEREKKEHEVADREAVAQGSETSRFLNADGTTARHRIVSVSSFADAFPDAQDVQIVSANRLGVSPVQDRAEAESRKAELVYVGSNPYYFVEPLYWSIPYLVPKAAVLLQDIGRNFIDSLQVKGLQPHRIIVTSVMRTKEEVARMRHYNGNVSENSCHMYGTTFDIAYNRYLPVAEVATRYSKQETASDVRLKQVLAEVLNDLRREGRCWVKYEVKQSCFHATVR